MDNRDVVDAGLFQVNVFTGGYDLEACFVTARMVSVASSAGFLYGLI